MTSFIKQKINTFYPKRNPSGTQKLAKGINRHSNDDLKFQSRGICVLRLVSWILLDTCKYTKARSAALTYITLKEAAPD